MRSAARWDRLAGFRGRHFAVYPATFSIFGHENDYPKPTGHIALERRDAILGAANRRQSAGPCSTALSRNNGSSRINSTASSVAAGR